MFHGTGFCRDRANQVFEMPLIENRTNLRGLGAAIAFVVLLVGFWIEVQNARIAETLGGHIGSAFLSFALLLAPLWFFGFGAGEALREKLRTVSSRILFSACLAIPYAVFAAPRGELHWVYLLTLGAIPICFAAIFELSRLEQRFTWQDFAVLLSLALILELRLLSGAWPYPGLGSLPKLYLADVALYVYLVNRKIKNAGYSFVPSRSAFLIGTREWLFFAPIGIGLGLAMGFINFIPRHHSLLDILAGLLVTFLLTAVPEELFFRGILQNLLEPRIGTQSALVVTAVVFGLSHFHKGAVFNWRYVLLAALAGIFYGRAWREHRQLLASSTTHTLVDVVWSLWFR